LFVGSNPLERVSVSASERRADADREKDIDNISGPVLMTGEPKTGERQLKVPDSVRTDDGENTANERGKRDVLRTFAVFITELACKGGDIVNAPVDRSGGDVDIAGVLESSRVVGMVPVPIKPNVVVRDDEGDNTGMRELVVHTEVSATQYSFTSAHTKFVTGCATFPVLPLPEQVTMVVAGSSPEKTQSSSQNSLVGCAEKAKNGQGL
jgi:hypothetical protein